MDRTFKIGLIGLGGVGKTSIVLRLVDDYFSRSFKPTTGVFRIDYHIEIDEVSVTLCVNDFPGDFDAAFQMKDLIKSLDAIFIVSNNDYRDPSVLSIIKQMVDDIHQINAFKNPYIALVSNLFLGDDDGNVSTTLPANQLALTSVSHEHIDTATLPLQLTEGEKATKELAATLQIDFYRVSAYTGAGIYAMFEAVSRKLINIQAFEFEKEESSSEEEDEEVKICKCFCIPLKRRL